MIFANSLATRCGMPPSAGQPFPPAATTLDAIRIVDAPHPVELVPVIEVSSDAAHAMPLLFPDCPRSVRLDGAIDETFLRSILSDTDPQTHLHQALDGGFALLAGGTVLFHPQCCSTLDDLFPFEKALEPWEFGWREIWIGHPCLIALRREDDVLLQGYVEPGGSNIRADPSEPAYRIASAAFEAAIAKARALRRRLVPAFARALPQPSDAIAARLLGVD